MHAFLGEIIHEALNFVSIFIATEMFKSFFTKRDLIRYYYFVNIYINLTFFF